MEQTNIESKYKNEFDDMIKDMESRMNKLKGINSSSSKERDLVKSTEDAESENEEESVRKIVEKVFKFFFHWDRCSSPPGPLLAKIMLIKRTDITVLSKFNYYNLFCLL